MRRMLMTAVAATALVLPVLTTTASASSDNAVDGQTQAAIARVCPAPPSGYASCDALRNDSASPDASAPSTSGKTPGDIRSAYNLASASGAGKTVAIVDAYNDPTAEADLGVYRAQYGLPACTTANGCFRKVNQTGGTSYPKTDGGWAQEISLDLDMVSAACPTCNILLVEATTPSFANLGAAVDYAAGQGVAAISNSYGGSDAADTTYGHYYNHPGVAVTVSSGDNGYGVEYPASSQYVTAVGGTSLKKDLTVPRGWTETAWSGAGSGCSTINPKPTWQTDAGCAKRTVADVSAVADPNTGVNVYDSTAYRGTSGWLVFGGTSASSPIIASVFAMGGHSAPSTPYAATSGLFDVTSGSNGSCGGSYLCTAKVGFDGPTGLGTPNGTAAF